MSNILRNNKAGSLTLTVDKSPIENWYDIVFETQDLSKCWFFNESKWRVVRTSDIGIDAEEVFKTRYIPDFTEQRETCDYILLTDNLVINFNRTEKYKNKTVLRCNILNSDNIVNRRNLIADDYFDMSKLYLLSDPYEKDNLCYLFENPKWLDQLRLRIDLPKHNLSYFIGYLYNRPEDHEVVISGESKKFIANLIENQLIRPEHVINLANYSLKNANKIKASGSIPIFISAKNNNVGFDTLIVQNPDREVYDGDKTVYKIIYRIHKNKYHRVKPLTHDELCMKFINENYIIHDKSTIDDDMIMNGKSFIAAFKAWINSSCDILKGKANGKKHIYDFLSKNNIDIRRGGRLVRIHNLSAKLAK